MMSNLKFVGTRIQQIFRVTLLLRLCLKYIKRHPEKVQKVSAMQRVLREDLNQVTFQKLNNFDTVQPPKGKSDKSNQFEISAARFNDEDVRLIGNNITRSIGHTALGLAQRFVLQEIGLSKNRYLAMAQEFGNEYYLSEYWGEFCPQLRNLPSALRLTELLSTEIWEEISSVSYGDTNLSCNEATSILFQEWFVKRKKKKILDLTQNNIELGEIWLKQNRIKESDWFVVIHNRWTNEGTQNPRNNRLQDYIPGIRHILDQGGFVIKVGLPDGQIINDMGDRYIDYSNSQSRREELDVFLYGSCRYMLSCSSGPAFVAANFGVPQLTLNITDLGAMPFIPNSIAVPKLRIEKNSKREKKFNEKLHLGVYDTDKLAEEFLLHYEFRNNSPDEIKSAIVEFHQVVEMNKLEEINTQGSRMQELISARTKCPTTRIAESFLEKHHEYFF
jgi:putative glycosyltransferase (TIGR04372 family)